MYKYNFNDHSCTSISKTVYIVNKFMFIPLTIAQFIFVED